jgi:hypothetical protein
VQTVGFATVHSLLISIVINQGQQCLYPDLAIPTCMLNNPCAFMCQPGLVLCPGLPVPSCQQSCPSGVTRRSAPQILVEADARCPTGWEVCSGLTSATAFECINTQTTLDSCGGCLFPYEGKNATGADCSAIHGVDHVSCRNGACFVESCTAGMAVSEDHQSCK